MNLFENNSSFNFEP